MTGEGDEWWVCWLGGLLMWRWWVSELEGGTGVRCGRYRSLRLRRAETG